MNTKYPITSPMLIPIPNPKTPKIVLMIPISNPSQNPKPLQQFPYQEFEDIDESRKGLLDSHTKRSIKFEKKGFKFNNRSSQQNDPSPREKGGENKQEKESIYITERGQTRQEGVKKTKGVGKKVRENSRPKQIRWHDSNGEELKKY